MKSAALIPARFASTRLPEKLIQDLGGKSVIQRTYESTSATGLFDEVWVVTDSETIQKQIKTQGEQLQAQLLEKQEKLAEKPKAEAKSEAKPSNAQKTEQPARK